MDLILLRAVTDGLTTAECTFTVKIDGGSEISGDTNIVGVTTVVMPDGARRIEIQALPASNFLWPLAGVFERALDGDFTVIDAPPEFAPPVRVSAGIAGLTVFTAHLSRLREATTSALASLAQVPAVRTATVPNEWPPATAGQPAGAWPPTDWNTPPLDDQNYIADLPLSGSDLSITQETVNPDTVDLVLELKGVSAPQAIGISWPAAIARTENASPTPFLLYFHAGVTQNQGQFYTHPQVGTYPFGFDYVYFGLWRYLNYIGDPLTQNPFCKGLPYQMAMAKKNAVIVLPSSKVGLEVGVFLSAASTEMVLREIQAFMFRRAGIYTPPAIGRTAMASFSSGNALVATFLGRSDNRSHTFYNETLREVYMFDAPGSMSDGWIAQALAWANHGRSDDKIIRAYTSHSVGSYSRLLGQGAPAGTFLASSLDTRRTAAVLPIAAWNKAATQAGNPNMAAGEHSWQQTHQLISAIMLKDALIRSNF